MKNIQKVHVTVLEQIVNLKSAPNITIYKNNDISTIPPDFSFQSNGDHGMHPYKRAVLEAISHDEKFPDNTTNWYGNYDRGADCVSTSGANCYACNKSELITSQNRLKPKYEAKAGYVIMDFPNNFKILQRMGEVSHIQVCSQQCWDDVTNCCNDYPNLSFNGIQKKLQNKLKIKCKSLPFSIPSNKIENKTTVTAQSIFDKIVSHLRKQGRKAMINGTCQYVTPSGDKCAAGVLIEDHEWEPWMNDPMFPGGFKDIAPKRYIPFLELISDMRQIHDNCKVKNWEKNFKLVAEKHHLIYDESTNKLLLNK